MFFVDFCRISPRKENEIGGSKKCREFYLKKMKEGGPSELNGVALKMEQIETSEQNDIALLKYIITIELNGKQIRFNHINAYLAHGETWIDIHLSKIMKPDDQRLFDDFLAKVKFIENYVPSYRDNISFGMEFFWEREYEKGSVYLQKALDAERQDRSLTESLDKFVWRLYIEALGLSYNVLEKPEKALEIFHYGLNNDSEYAMFYYGQAYAYGRLDNMDKTLDNLKMAFKYKNSLTGNRKIPNPKTYAGFKKFFENPTFAKEIELLLK